VAVNGITFIPNFMKIVLKLLNRGQTGTKIEVKHTTVQVSKTAVVAKATSSRA
jgi:hypothetical protein